MPASWPQMLRAAGHELYFHEYMYMPEEAAKEKKYEIDFMTVKKKKICPIEVKSSNYMSHKSFDYLIQKYQLKMEDRYIIYTKDLKFEDGIMYIPIYMTMFLYVVYIWYICLNYIRYSNL